MILLNTIWPAIQTIFLHHQLVARKRMTKNSMIPRTTFPIYRKCIARILLVTWHIDIITIIFTGTPLTVEKWSSFHDADGNLIVSPYEVACTIFCGGIEPSLRRQIWPRILNAIDWKSKKDADWTELKHSYQKMKESWVQMLHDAGEHSPTKLSIPQEGAVGDENEHADVISKLTERFYRIDKDVARTDQSVEFFQMSGPIDPNKPLRYTIDANPNLATLRCILMTFTMYDFELGISFSSIECIYTSTDVGYVQGMNDLCSPILETIQDEAESFWSYVGFMKRMVESQLKRLILNLGAQL